MRKLLFFLIIVFNVHADFFIVLNSGKTRNPIFIKPQTIYEDVYDYVHYEIVDSSNSVFVNGVEDTVAFKVLKKDINYVVCVDDTVFFDGKRDVRIDTTSCLHKEPQDGGYLSITELYYNQPSKKLEDLAVEYERKVHEVLRKRAKRYSKSLEKTAYLVGESKSVPIRGVCKNGEMYWGTNQEMFILTVSPFYSFYEAKYTIHEHAYFSIGVVSVSAQGLPRDVGKQLFIIDMKSREERLLTKSYLKKLLKKHDPQLLKQFKRQRNKDEHLKTYLLKLLESLENA